MKAKHLTPEHIGRLARVKIPSGAVIEATLKTLDAHRAEVDQGLSAKAVRALCPDDGLVITITFEEMSHRWLGYISATGHDINTKFELSPSAPVTILD